MDCSCYCILAFLPLFYILYETISPTFDGFSPSMISKKRVFIGGASSGIGEQMAYHYSKMGAHVAVLSRRKEVLEKVAAKCRELGAASAVVVAEDVSTPENSKKALDVALNSKGFNGKLDILVLNHVIGIWGWWLPDNIKDNDALLDGPNENVKGLSYDKFNIIEKIFRVNTFSYFYLATMAMPKLINNGNDGSIIVVSSGAGGMGLPKVSPYSASKHALHGFFDSLRLEVLYKELPVTISIGIIGNIDTKANRDNTKGDLKYAPKHASKEDCAMAIIRAGATKQNLFYFPLSQGLHIMPKLRPWFKDWLDLLLLKIAI
jgi:corticosteroid 11-beta-dehydrogenase isozyme 1